MEVFTKLSSRYPENQGPSNLEHREKHPLRCSLIGALTIGVLGWVVSFSAGFSFGTIIASTISGIVVGGMLAFFFSNLIEPGALNLKQDEHETTQVKK
jgi:hypothetical protein